MLLGCRCYCSSHGLHDNHQITKILVLNVLTRPKAGIALNRGGKIQIWTFMDYDIPQALKSGPWEFQSSVCCARIENAPWVW